MASSHVLPHVVTIFNYVGKGDDGKPKYQATLLSGVYFREHRAVNGISAPDDYAIAHIFDKGTIASDGRRFLDRYEWDDKLDHTGFRRKQDLLKARMTRKTRRTDLVFSFRAIRRRRQMLLLPVLQMRSSASGERMIDD